MSGKANGLTTKNKDKKLLFQQKIMVPARDVHLMTDIGGAGYPIMMPGFFLQLDIKIFTNSENALQLKKNLTLAFHFSGILSL